MKDKKQRMIMLKALSKEKGISLQSSTMDSIKLPSYRVCPKIPKLLQSVTKTPHKQTAAVSPEKINVPLKLVRRTTSAAKPKGYDAYTTLMETDEYHLVEHRRGRQSNTSFVH